eukprot:11870571-Alexandrium_andersonii.AAC.1
MVTARTWRSHLAAASLAYWCIGQNHQEGTRLSPADLFRHLLAWASTELRSRLHARADRGHRYCTLSAVAVILARGARADAGSGTGWIRDLTEDGDVGDNPGPPASRPRGTRLGGGAASATVTHLSPGSDLLRGPEDTT